MRTSATDLAVRGGALRGCRTDPAFDPAAAFDRIAHAARRRQARTRRDGFTLIELSLVLAAMGALFVLAIASYENSRNRVRVAQAAFDIAAISTLVSHYALDNRGLPDSLADAGAGGRVDPWGRPYQYVNHEAKGSHGDWRRDKYIVPINSDFDVFSTGKDGLSRPPLTAKDSRDDIVRANNGRFVGLASDYDP